MNSFLEIKLLFVLLAFNVHNGIAQTLIAGDHSIAGYWKFVETRDNSGKVIQYYSAGAGLEKVDASGPDIYLHADGSYVKTFDPKHADSGYWAFNKPSMKIEYDLYIDSTDWIGKDLIKNKLAVKQNDGNYYERVEDKVIKIEAEEMIIEERGAFFIYKKEKRIK